VRVADDDQRLPGGGESQDSGPDEVDAPEPEAGVVEESDELDLDDLDEPESGPVSPPEPESHPEQAIDELHGMPDLFASEPPTDDATDDTTGATPPRRRQVRLALIGVLAVLGVLYVVGFIMTGLRMPANATIGGVDVSGMPRDEARVAVDRELSPRVGEEVVLQHDGTEFTVDPKAAGLTFDLDRSIDDAGANYSGDPRKMIGLVFGTHEFDPAVDADDKELTGIVVKIATAIDREVVEPQITFPKKTPTPREPKAGLVVRRPTPFRPSSVATWWPAARSTCPPPKSSRPSTPTGSRKP
jgi:hypothetical protein